MLSVRVLPRRGVTAASALSTAEIMVLLVAAHTWAGGALPGAGWLAVTTALVFLAGTVALRLRAPLLATVPALTAAQLLLHGWLVTLAPAQAGAHVHGPALDLTWRMVLAHVVGAAVTGLVWHLRRRAVEVVLGWTEAGLVPVADARLVPAHRAPLLPLRRPLVVVPLRGPPVALLTA